MEPYARNRFWFCYYGTLVFAGTVVAFALSTGLPASFGPVLAVISILGLLTFPFPIALCFISSRRVTSDPRLAKLSMYTVAAVVGVFSVLLGILYLVWKN
jgi:hypothetical protein